MVAGAVDEATSCADRSSYRWRHDFAGVVSRDPRAEALKARQ
jgi:hypothetical protein